MFMLYDDPMEGHLTVQAVMLNPLSHESLFSNRRNEHIPPTAAIRES